jgi:hypothetical protein
VYDLDRPIIIAPPGSTQPMLAWERVYFVDGRTERDRTGELQTRAIQLAVASSDVRRACVTQPS